MAARGRCWLRPRCQWPSSYNLLNAVVARAQAGGGYASTYAASSYDKNEHEAVARSQLWPSITGGSPRWHARGDEMLAMVATRYPYGTLSTVPIGSLRNMLEVSSTFTDCRASASASREASARARAVTVELHRGGTPSRT